MKWLLNHPSCYLFFQSIVGAKRARRRCIEQYVKAVEGERVLDVGCGPGFVVDYLSPVEFVGLDIDERYIAHAQKKYGDRAEFHCVELTADNADSFGKFDVVMLNGVLHHLNDDEAAEMLRLLHSCLRDNGRLVTLDGCYQEGMSAFSRWMLNNDRGQYVRNEEQYVELAKKSFPELEVALRNDLLFIPYDLIIMVCRKAAAQSIAASDNRRSA